MKSMIIIILMSLFLINDSNAKFNKTVKIENNITIKYSGFNNENIEYDLKSKSIQFSDRNTPLNSYFRSVGYSKVKYIDFDNDQYESRDFRNWSFVQFSENNIKDENKGKNTIDLNLNVYPNPILDKFSVNIRSKIETNITLILNDVTKETKIELLKLTNFKGEIEKTFNSDELGLVRGVYFVTLSTNQGIILKRFIKV